MHRDKGRMLAILFHVEAKPGKRQDLADFLVWDCAICFEKEPRTLRFDVLQDPANEQAFYVYEAYEDTTAFEEHKQNQPYRRWSSAEFQSEVVANHKRLFEGAPECLRWSPSSRM